MANIIAITFALLQRFVEFEPSGTRSHSGHLQTRVTALRIHAKWLVSGTSVRQDGALVDI